MKFTQNNHPYHKWRFPKIGVPPNHPFIDKIFHGFPASASLAFFHQATDAHLRDAQNLRQRRCLTLVGYRCHTVGEEFLKPLLAEALTKVQHGSGRMARGPNCLDHNFSIDLFFPEKNKSCRLVRADLGIDSMVYYGFLQVFVVNSSP